ncbi:Maf family nucleotide pyrophosphatase [Bacteroidales bacterium OttesenSCG-928-C19]|nr:Maf family nucleotide pyrophosphatase [Bacteroidales bacterium OttesenSCG-928-C19]
MMEFLNQYKLILGSKSPRRKQLLEGLGFSVEVREQQVEEIVPNGISLKDIPAYLAELKASAFLCSEIKQNEVVVTADTAVILGDLVLGKPKNEVEAFAFLKKLSGNTHFVVTGVCLKTFEKKQTFSSETFVSFRELSDEEIQHYVSTFKPMDKAGAYGIQEWIGHIGVESIQGSYFNVMGLPTQKLFVELKKLLKSDE